MNVLPDEAIELRLNHLTEATQLAEDIAICARPGWLIGLQGDLGTGKTAFARAFIRALTNEPDLEVPSPSFSIVQTYECDFENCRLTILHGDLYRLSDPEELREVGLDGSLQTTIRLVEWHEIGNALLGVPDLSISFESCEDDEARKITLRGQSSALISVSRSLAIRTFLDAVWGKGVQRQRLAGDASARSYETVLLGGEQRILMNAPRRPDGPPIRDGKPYSQIAQLAEDIERFLEIDEALASLGLKVPEIHASDLGAGLMLLEDMGNELIIDDGRHPIPDRYLAAAELLAYLHRTNGPDKQGFFEETGLSLRPYGEAAMMIEVELLLDWYAPRFKGAALSDRERKQFLDVWSELIERLGASDWHLVLRDYHSPNILWQPAERDIRRLGLIDFQDAVYGPTAYDLASLAQDARVDVPEELERSIFEHYAQVMAETDQFDKERFSEAYAISCALRTTKILGIFVRLDERDDKPGYLKHLPRIQAYIKRSFEHPSLSDYRDWYSTVIGL